MIEDLIERSNRLFYGSTLFYHQFEHNRQMAGISFAKALLENRLTSDAKDQVYIRHPQIGYVMTLHDE